MSVGRHNTLEEKEGEEEEESLLRRRRRRRRRRRGSFERRCLLTTDDADLVEISSVFNHFPQFVAKKRKRFGPVLTVRSTMTPASASAMKSDCTLTSAGPYGHCLQTPKNNAAKPYAGLAALQTGKGGWELLMRAKGSYEQACHPCTRVVRLRLPRL